MMNADILTRLSFAKMLREHEENEAGLSVATKRQEIQIPYGVIESAAGDSQLHRKAGYCGQLQYWRLRDKLSGACPNP